MRTLKHLFLVFIFSIGLFATSQPQEPVFSSVSAVCHTVVYRDGSGSEGIDSFLLSIRAIPEDGDTEFIEFSIVDDVSNFPLFPMHYEVTEIDSTTIQVDIDLSNITMGDDGYYQYTVTYGYTGCDSQTVTVAVYPPVPDNPGEE